MSIKLIVYKMVLTGVHQAWFWLYTHRGLSARLHAVSPLLMHWRYCGLALSHWHDFQSFIYSYSFPKCCCWLDDIIKMRAWSCETSPHFNTQNYCHFADGIFKCIFLNENVWISFNISLEFFLKVQINNIPALAHRPGVKPLSEPMMFSLLMHI